MKLQKRRDLRLSSSRQIDLETWLMRAMDLLEQGQPEEALAVLEKVPAHLQSDSEYRYLRGICLFLVGEAQQAIVDLESALAREPARSPRHFQLVLAYANAECVVHAWVLAERLVQNNAGDAKVQRALKDLIGSVRQIAIPEAESLHAPLATFQKAALAHERSLLHLAEGRYADVVSECSTCIRLISNWVPPRNNRAYAYFLSNKIAEAKQEEVYVLKELDPHNVHALSNLIIFHFASFEDEAVGGYAAHLRQLLAANLYKQVDLEKLIDAFAWAADTESLWAIGGRLFREKVETLSGMGWYALAAAAANLEHLKEARRFFQHALEMGSVVDHWAEEGLRCLNYRQRPVQGFDIQGRFPYQHFSRLLPQSALNEVLKLAASAETAATDANLARFVKNHAYLLGAFRLMLWHEQDPIFRTMAADLLVGSGLPAAAADVRAFAGSQHGSSSQRLLAVRALRQAGLLDANAIIDFWDDSHQRWTQVNFREQSIVEPEKPLCNAEAMTWLEKAFNIAPAQGPQPPAEALRQAIAYLEKAVAADPSCAQAIHNLGVQYMNLGEREKGVALVRKSVEVDPDYLFGHATLANIEYGEGRIAEAKQLAQKVASAAVVPPEAFLRASQTLFWIALGEEDDALAANIFETLEGMFLDDERLAPLQQALESSTMSARFHELWLQGVHRAHWRLLHKPLAADANLKDCLGRISRESLVGALHAWGVSTVGRKADLIARLCQMMLDPSALHDFVHETLRQQEREALHWVLAAGGVRPWAEFIAQFGDDLDESPYWQYHEPNTVTGRLKMMGLLAAGTLNDVQVAFLATDLRPVLVEVLGNGETGKPGDQ